jgi:hypothetical protein
MSKKRKSPFADFDMPAGPSPDKSKKSFTNVKDSKLVEERNQSSLEKKAEVAQPSLGKRDKGEKQ